jgi:hypothetical protein
MRGEKSNLRIMNKPLKYKFFDDGAGGSGSQILDSLLESNIS